MPVPVLVLAGDVGQSDQPGELVDVLIEGSTSTTLTFTTDAIPGSEFHAVVRQLNPTLDARSRRIIEARWLVEDDPATLQDLADEYGVSAERIRQIEGKALKSMRAQMSAT